MANLFQMMESRAARGAEGLTPEARETLGAALLALQTAEGGFAGLDGRADPYYSVFAWLSLRALGVAFERERLCVYMQARRRAAKRIDAQCAQILLAVEGRKARVPWVSLAAAFFRGDTREVYGAFLLALVSGNVPRGLARVAWWRQRRLFEADAAERLPTPRLAAGLILAALAGDRDAGLLPALSSRWCAGGGVASAAGAPADLLATAVARFAWRFGSTEPRLPCADDEIWRASVPASRTREDLAFIESCWLEDGLFGASPAALHGDAEHTFYGLLALGTCRTGHS
jgi:hypothetical protein